MVTIRLPGGVWQYDPNEQLGPEGGFGAVFAGVGADGTEVAVKKLKLEAGDLSHREINVAGELASRQLTHVLPILDAGQDAESDAYFVVMPRAERSLQDELSKGRTWQGSEAAAILLQIAEGLSEVPDLVHRDLKPGNILFHDGRWKIADFGIARFIEDATSTHTLKECLSPEYAAPEQWELKRVTSATDVYALGCVGYAILTGAPPYQESSTEALRAKHLHDAPPAVEHANPRLGALLLMMLRKNPPSRPGLDRVRTLLQPVKGSVAASEPQNGFAELAKANVRVEAEVSEKEAHRAELAARHAERKELAAQGMQILSELRNKLLARICEIAPSANRLGGRMVRICGCGQLKFELPADHFHMPSEFQRSKWDFVIGVVLQVEQDQPRYIRSASLWYARQPGQDSYRWFETAYETHPLMRGRRTFEPFALSDPAEADRVAGPGMHEIQIAYGPLPIDDEDADAFFDRWAGLLAKAAAGELHLHR